MLKLTVLLVLVAAGISNAKRILFIPGPATSHCLEMMAIGEELLKRGHQITVYSLVLDPKHCIQKDTVEAYKSHFKFVTPKIGFDHQKFREEFQSTITTFFFERRNMFQFMWKYLLPAVRNDCDTAFGDKKLLLELENDKYDLVVVEGIPFFGCFQAMAKLLNAPIAAVSAYVDFEDSRMPLQTSTFPSILTEFSNDMTFTQRLINTLIHLASPVLKAIIMPSIDLGKYDERLTGVDMMNLLKDAEVFIENSDYIVDYPKAIYPNFVQAGALTATPAKPLPDDLKKIMDNAKQGVVLCTFGSMLKEMPSGLKKKFMDTFSRLKHQVLFKQDKDEVIGNVRIMKWIPQNDVLGHRNTKLFISHCGKNGFWESVYHGVPIICMAIHAETYTTKVKVRKYGIGSAINIFDDTVEELVKTINDVLSNETISRNMKRKSSLLRDRAETPREKAASAIEHVLKYGGEHMRPPSVDMNFIIFTCLDVWCTLFLVVAACIWFDIWLIRKCCCGSKVQKSKTD